MAGAEHRRYARCHAGLPLVLQIAPAYGQGCVQGFARDEVLKPDTDIATHRRRKRRKPTAELLARRVDRASIAVVQLPNVLFED